MPKLLLGIVLGTVLGIVALGAARFVATPWPDVVHHHANWAVFVDGRRLDLSGDRYMEEVEACVAGEDILPTQRAHMHNNEQDVVHVHHTGVTWGHFLSNLGFVLGDGFLVLDDGTELRADAERGFTFIVNGFRVPDIRDRLIRSGDRFLLSFGPESAEQIRSTQLEAVASDAEEYNERMDPAGCSGSAEPTFLERLQMAFWG